MWVYSYMSITKPNAHELWSISRPRYDVGCNETSKYFWFLRWYPSAVPAICQNISIQKHDKWANVNLSPGFRFEHCFFSATRHLTSNKIFVYWSRYFIISRFLVYRVHCQHPLPPPSPTAWKRKYLFYNLFLFP